jgi:gelsolin
VTHDLIGEFSANQNPPVSFNLSVVMADLKRLKLTGYLAVIKSFIIDDQGELKNERKTLLENLRVTLGITEKEHEGEWKAATTDFFVKRAIKSKEDTPSDKPTTPVPSDEKDTRTLSRSNTFTYSGQAPKDQPKIELNKIVLKKVDMKKINEDKVAKFGVQKHKNCAEKAFESAGFTQGLLIWRIENFLVQPWPEKEYGNFFEGDSYIVLNTYKKDDFGYSMGWDLHFWLGKESSRDEMGTAALKSVELDDILGGRAIQYREVQGHESEKFLSLFPNGRKLMSGGIDSGFNEVKPLEYKPRLFHIKGTKTKQRCDETKCTVDSLNDGDAFVLDAGLQVYLWEGRSASRAEKLRAAYTAQDIKSKRKGVTINREEIGKETEEFWALLGGKGPIKSAEDGGDDDEALAGLKHSLFQLSDETGTMQFTKRKEGLLESNDFKTEDVFIADCGELIVVWIGNGTTAEEKKSAMIYGQKYLKDTAKPDWIPLVRMLEGNEGAVFWNVIKKSDKPNDSKLQVTTTKGEPIKVSPRFKSTVIKCPVCKETVYGGDPSYEIKGEKYHQNCLKCLKCKMSLNISNYKSFEGQIYCRSHYNEVTEPVKLMVGGLLQTPGGTVAPIVHESPLFIENPLMEKEPEPEVNHVVQEEEVVEDIIEEDPQIETNGETNGHTDE